MINCLRQERMYSMKFGPKAKNDILENEELQIVEAFQEAEEYILNGFVEDDFNFYPED